MVCTRYGATIVCIGISHTNNNMHIQYTAAWYQLSPVKHFKRQNAPNLSHSFNIVVYECVFVCVSVFCVCCTVNERIRCTRIFERFHFIPAMNHEAVHSHGYRIVFICIPLNFIAVFAGESIRSWWMVFFHVVVIFFFHSQFIWI